MYKLRKGFTLAEVLITLLIIGVVSSIVIPGLISDMQDQQYKVAYKKAFAEASLITRNALLTGAFVPRTSQYDSNATLNNFNVFKNQFSITKECNNNNNDQCWNPSGEQACTDGCSIYPQGLPYNTCRAFIDNSGMAWSMYTYSEDIILVDTNGNKGPNRYGKDRWMLLFKDKNNNYLTVGLPYKIGPAYNNDITSPSNLACHYPPCYYISWLKQ